MSVSFMTAAALVNELMEARDTRRLLRGQKQMAGVKLMIIDEARVAGSADNTRFSAQGATAIISR
jgi:DNA replication protein DnaC